ncbi:hypothetical protein ANCCEY_02440 [Ancylostoma ceylanicum]|uniref:RRM domain-containing protein n=1 Tax=Ancylostoma ceylanicum TaxID=53326 RepID=A0A0D6M2L8_9BILA|nr:hypothetical protein ANCCEY_02440 [Ancylostoma ceylanicum]
MPNMQSSADVEAIDDADFNREMYRLLMDNHPQPIYSRKVFLGGLPPHITTEELQRFFLAFGTVEIGWPVPESNNEHDGFMFATFTSADSVVKLVENCVRLNGRLTINMPLGGSISASIHIRVWCTKDAKYCSSECGDSILKNTRNCVFVGGIPRTMTARQLSCFMSLTFGDVTFAKIEVELETDYPKGAGCVMFRDREAFVAAIASRFVPLNFGDHLKQIELQPYLMRLVDCDICQRMKTRNFCPKLRCLKFMCEMCWKQAHVDMPEHQPQVRSPPLRSRAATQSNFDDRRIRVMRPKLKRLKQAVWCGCAGGKTAVSGYQAFGKLCGGVTVLGLVRLFPLLLRRTMGNATLIVFKQTERRTECGSHLDETFRIAMTDSKCNIMEQMIANDPATFRPSWARRNNASSGARNLDGHTDWNTDCGIFDSRGPPTNTFRSHQLPDNQQQFIPRRLRGRSAPFSERNTNSVDYRNRWRRTSPPRHCTASRCRHCNNGHPNHFNTFSGADYRHRLHSYQYNDSHENPNYFYPAHCTEDNLWSERISGLSNGSFARSVFASNVNQIARHRVSFSPTVRRPARRHPNSEVHYPTNNASEPDENIPENVVGALAQFKLF